MMDNISLNNGVIRSSICEERAFAKVVETVEKSDFKAAIQDHSLLYLKLELQFNRLETISHVKSAISRKKC